MKDVNEAEVIVKITVTVAPPNPLTIEWNAAATTDAKLGVIAKALGIS